MLNGVSHKAKIWLEKIEEILFWSSFITKLSWLIESIDFFRTK